MSTQFNHIHTFLWTGLKPVADELGYAGQLCLFLHRRKTKRGDAELLDFNGGPARYWHITVKREGSKVSDLTQYELMGLAEQFFEDLGASDSFYIHPDDKNPDYSCICQKAS